MAQTKTKWSEVRPLLRNRPKNSPQRFREAGFAIRPEDNWYAPPRNMADRYELYEDFSRAPKAARTMVTFTASVALAEMQAYVQGNHDFEHVGTNNSNDDITVLDNGGVRLETDNAANDALILQGITGSTGCPNPTKWVGTEGAVKWETSREPHWGAVLQTTATITATTLWAGLKLTNVNTIATDADQAFFRCAAGEWSWVYSVGGTDYNATAGVSLATGTLYDLKIIVDEGRYPNFYINGIRVAAATHALTTTTSMSPFVGIITGANASKSVEVHKQWISQNMG